MTTVDTPAPARLSPVLRRLYFVRFAFAIVWAILLFTTAKSGLPPIGIALVILYPLFDLGSAIVDARSANGASVRGLYVNIVISLLATVGIAYGSTSGIPAVLRVWGAWAIVAGIIQLVVAIVRRKLGGQWPMILSGGISVLAGASFVAGAAAPHPALSNVAGYAVLGGIFFLISAIRLGRAGKEN